MCDDRFSLGHEVTFPVFSSEQTKSPEPVNLRWRELAMPLVGAPISFRVAFVLSIRYSRPAPPCERQCYLPVTEVIHQRWTPIAVGALGLVDALKGPGNGIEVILLARRAHEVVSTMRKFFDPSARRGEYRPLRSAAAVQDVDAPRPNMIRTITEAHFPSPSATHCGFAVAQVQIRACPLSRTRGRRRFRARCAPEGRRP